MNNTQHTYFAELGIALQKAGYTVQPEKSGVMPVEWNGCPLCRVTEEAFACFTTIVWINGNLLFYGCILVCSVKTDSLRGFPVFIFKTGKASNALICRDTVSV